MGEILAVQTESVDRVTRRHLFDQQKDEDKDKDKGKDKDKVKDKDI